MQNFVEYLTVMATNDSLGKNLTKYNLTYPNYIIYNIQVHYYNDYIYTMYLRN